MFLTPPKDRRAHIKALFNEAKDLGLLDELLGKPGTDGARGERGERGEQGLRGDVGENGAPGERGEVGEKGDRGLRGSRGPKGEDGTAGERGSRGARGEKGADGIDGRDASVDATFITFDDERDELPESRRLVPGPNILIEKIEDGKLRISSTGGGIGGGGPISESLFSGVKYLIQEDQVRYWQDDEFVHGHTIIGVRYAGAAIVYIPHGLSIEKIISVKNEMDGGSVSVRSY